MKIPKHKQEEFKKLKRKYFWQQKRKEVVDFFEEGWWAFAVMMVVVGGFLQIGWTINVETGLPENKTLAIIGICMVGFWILVGLIALFRVIRKWLRSNWKEALERAEKDSKKDSKGK